MNPKYPHRHWSKAQRVALVLVIFLGVLAGAAGLFVYIDMQQNGSTSVQGTSQAIALTAGAEDKKFIVDDPLFSLELPSDWKEVSRINNAAMFSITWQATKKYEDNRTLTAYIDRIPQTLDVNKILPVTVQGERLLPGDISDRCINFTSGSSKDLTKTVGIQDMPAKWMDVDFICDMNNIIDNVVGVGSTAGLNQIVVKGPRGGTHKYFFVYADRNIHPDQTILTTALQSFKAK